MDVAFGMPRSSLLACKVCYNHNNLLTRSKPTQQHQFYPGVSLVGSAEANEINCKLWIFLAKLIW